MAPSRFAWWDGAMDRSRGALGTTMVAFAIGFVIHNGDHVRRGFAEIADGVILGGTIVAMMTAVMLTLVATRHPAAPAVCAVAGAAIAAGVAASHLLPDWGPLSDSLSDGDVDALTWIAVFAEILTGAAVAAVAGSILRRHDYSPIIDWA